MNDVFFSSSQVYLSVGKNKKQKGNKQMNKQLIAGFSHHKENMMYIDIIVSYFILKKNGKNCASCLEHVK